VSLGFAMTLLALTVLAMALVVAPLLWRQRPAPSSEAYNLAVYRDQLAEIDRDIERGVLGADDAASARAEIGRRMLALPPATAAPRASRASLAVIAVAVLALPFAAWALYWQLGSPSLPDDPFASRRAQAQAADPHADMGKAVAQLALHLHDHPDDLAGWVLMGRSEIDLGRYHDAADAYRRAVELSNQRPDIVGDWGEALVLEAGGTVTAAARRDFEASLKDPDAAPRSRYYLALASLQHGDTKAALQSWVDLAGDSAPDAQYMPLLRRRIAETAKQAGVDPATLKTSSGKPLPAPTPEPTAEQREATIRGMVAGLAAKLQEHPDDPEGWSRLGRSYMVLGEPDKAVDAYQRAVKLKPDDAALKAALDEAQAAAKAKAK
jgi:cytochrome c-type biogenesis protein CcmH